MVTVEEAEKIISAQTKITERKVFTSKMLWEGYWQKILKQTETYPHTIV
jgi:hypothetical protein